MLADLVPHPGNPKAHDLGVIGASVDRFGYIEPVVVDERTGRLLAGHGRSETLRLMEARGDRPPDGIVTDEGGRWLVPVVLGWASRSDSEADAAVIALNRSTELGGWVDESLLELLDGLAAGPGLQGVGFGESELAELRARLAPAEQLNDPDEVPALPARARSRPGDVWLLGEHRLLVGDAGEPGVWDVLLGDGEQADLIFTDPPYGVDYQGRLGASPAAGWSRAQHDAYARHRRRDGLKVSNDNLGLEGTRRLVAAVFAVAPLRPGGVFYVCAPPGDMEMAFRLGLEDAGLPMRHSLVWVKDQFTFGRSDYHYRHESLLYGWRKGAGHYFVEDRTQDSVWEIARPRRSKVHPTMKPAALVGRAVENSSRPGDLVLDPFAGSGTTLIACQDSGRRAVCVELDPAYADVICRRFQEHTGVLPARQDGTPVDFTVPLGDGADEAGEAGEADAGRLGDEPVEV